MGHQRKIIVLCPCPIPRSRKVRKVISTTMAILVFVSIILVRYGEIGLKGAPVRRRFESLLIENIVRAHRQAGISCIVERQRGRLFVSSDAADTSVDILSRTFGVVSISLAEECSSEMEEISNHAATSMSDLVPLPGSSFAVRARRTGDHPYTSNQLAAEVGAKILNAMPPGSLRVDLSNPEIEIFIEVRNNRAFLFDRVIPGPGGLPLRSQGRVLCVIEDPKSLLAAWLMMRRGCSAMIINRSDMRYEEIERLKIWNPWWNGIIEQGDISEELGRRRCQAIALGWTLEEFLRRERPMHGVPVFYPLIGMADDEIEDKTSSVLGQVPRRL